MRRGSSFGKTGWWLDQDSSGDGGTQTFLRLPVFQIGQPGFGPAPFYLPSPWTNHLMQLSLIFPIWKMGTWITTSCVYSENQRRWNTYMSKHSAQEMVCSLSVSFLLFWDLSVPPSEGSPTWRAGLKNPVQAFPVIGANFLSLEWKNFWGFIHQGKTIFRRELSPFWLLCHQAVWSWTGHSTSESLFSHLQKEVSVSIQLCMPGGKTKGDSPYL